MKKYLKALKLPQISYFSPMLSIWQFWILVAPILLSVNKSRHQIADLITKSSRILPHKKVFIVTETLISSKLP